MIANMNTMKTLKLSAALLLAAVFAAAPLTSLAAEKAKDEKKAAKPYLLKTCIVSDEKLGGHGAPYVFTHEGREIKMCCKGCVKDFKKDTAKYIKKLEVAEKKLEKKAN